MALMISACSSNDIEQTAQQPDNKAEGIPFTATISIGESATTRALTESGSNIVPSWAAGEKVALIHNDVIDVVEVQSVSNGLATLTGTLTGSPANDDDVMIIYPSSAADGTTGNVKADLLAAQDGTLATIAEKYDVRKGAGTLNVGATATLYGNVSLTNQFAIVKFTIKNSDGSATIDVRPLTINIGPQNYVITPASATSELYVALPAVSSQTVKFLATSSDGETKYNCSKAVVSFTANNYYQSILKMNPGVLHGKFAINASGDKVYFSQGNLQAVCASADDNGNTQELWTWRFAANQWDYIGAATANNAINGNGSVSVAGTVDYFGWVGASSTVLTTAPAMYGISNSLTGNDYGTKKSSEGETLKSDWGNVTITNGGTYIWRTLTGDEWDYVFSTRPSSTVNSTTNGRYAKATVAGKVGVILFPDSYTHPSDVTAPISVNDEGAAYDANIYDANAWCKMESAGCVFLPAAGTKYSASDLGYYWSSTPGDNNNSAITLSFGPGYITTKADTDRYYGRSVRLVHAAE